MNCTLRWFCAAVICTSALQAQGPSGTTPKPSDTKPSAKSYRDIVTPEAITDSGVFITHRIKEKLLYEIPLRTLGTDFLLVSRQSKTQSGIGYGGDEVNNQVVRWERSGDKIFLRSVLFASVASDSLPISYAVRKATSAPILAAFDIQTYNRDSSSAVVDVTDLFVTDIPEIGIQKNQREQLRVRRLDSRRSFISSVKSFPNNVEVEATVTYEAGNVPPSVSLASVTLTLHHSMVLLPERQMMPRLFDSRVPYFSVMQVDYGYDAQRAEQRRYIARWRLEPKDSGAVRGGGLSDPVSPIVFYVDPAVPIQWRRYVREGVDAWQKVFEKAGFSNAIIARDAPTPQQDPDWNGEDARYSVIRWLPSEIENAYGPHISDPRSGEILEAHIGIFHNVMNLVRKWYFVHAGASDPRAGKLPMPDSLMGELIRYVVTHEVGHSLGFPHNMKSTSQYPVDSLRSAAFTERYGTEASIMDYGRFNYIAQPGDGARLIPILGPYDYFATEWGYRPVLSANTPDEEKPVLAGIAVRQESEPYLRFGGFDDMDPAAQTEDLGDDPVRATAYGLKNLARVADMLLNATTKDGEDYSDLKEMYWQVLTQRNLELGHAARVIGGINRTERYAGTQGTVFSTVSRERQRKAMSLLLSEAFRTPVELIRPELLALIEPAGPADGILAYQRQILNIILSNDRLARLANTAALAQQPAYTLSEMITDLQNGIWSELKSTRVTTTLYRRNLQRTYIELLGAKLQPQPPVLPPAAPGGAVGPVPTPAPGEAKALIRHRLTSLDAALASALKKNPDGETRAHLEDSRYQISRALHPDEK